MRRASCLVGLTLAAWAVTARAEQAAPAAAAPVAGPAAAPPPAAAPAVNVDATAVAPPPAVPASAERQRRFQIGLAVLPMARGKITATAAGKTSHDDGAFAAGVGLSVGYEVYRGLVVGIAPQAIFLGKIKTNSGAAQKHYDLLARVAYGYSIPDVVTLYAEVLPGYSFVHPSDNDMSKGFVLAFGVGAAMDLSQQVFVNMGAGYEMGFQNQTATANYRVNYIRAVLGVGMKF